MVTMLTTFIPTYLSSSKHQTENDNIQQMFLTIWDVAGRCSIATAQQGVVTDQESISEEAVLNKNQAK